MDCSVADEDEADDEDGEDGGAEEAHEEVADAVVVAVGGWAPGGAGVGLALEFVDHGCVGLLLVFVGWMRFVRGVFF